MDYYPVQAYRPATMECVLQSAIERNVPANVLLAIIQIEAGKEGSAIRNTNGSLDLGRSGINTVQLEELRKNRVFMSEMARQGLSENQLVHFLRFDGCYNVRFAAYLLHKRLTENPQKDFWYRAASYHSKTQSLNHIYQQKLKPLSREWARFLKVKYNVKDYMP